MKIFVPHKHIDEVRQISAGFEHCCRIGYAGACGFYLEAEKSDLTLLKLSLAEPGWLSL